MIFPMIFPMICEERFRDRSGYRPTPLISASTSSRPLVSLMFPRVPQEGGLVQDWGIIIGKLWEIIGKLLFFLVFLTFVGYLLMS